MAAVEVVPGRKSSGRAVEALVIEGRQAKQQPVLPSDDVLSDLITQLRTF